jgi:hypothetical protein
LADTLVTVVEDAAPLVFVCVDFFCDPIVEDFKWDTVVDELAAACCATSPPLISSDPAKTTTAHRYKFFPSNIASRSNTLPWRLATLARS